MQKEKLEKLNNYISTVIADAMLNAPEELHHLVEIHQFDTEFKDHIIIDVAIKQ